MECILLGYNSESKAFRIYDPVEKRIHISRDVIFEEEKKCTWDKNYSAEQDIKLEWENEHDGEMNVEGDMNDEEVEDDGAQNETDQPQPHIGNPQFGGEERETQIRRTPISAVDYTSGDDLTDAE